jgi:tetratricopeptide (TPR) repeat protein
LVTKYESLYDAVPNIFSGIVRFNKFSDCFWSIKYINTFISFEQKINSASDDFSRTDMSIDSNLLNWLLTYEDVGLEMLNILNYDALADDSNYLIINLGFNFYVSCDEFKNEIEFAKLFQKKYWAVLREYEEREAGDVLVNNMNYDLFNPKKLKDYVNDKNLIEPNKIVHLTDLQICNWVPLRYIAQDSTTQGGIRLNQAHELFHQDNYEAALNLYKEILETRDDFHEAWIGLAASHYMLGNYDEALTASYNLQKNWAPPFITNFSKQCELKSRQMIH